MTQTDISDLSLSTVNGGGALSLPIRREKIVLVGTAEPVTDKTLTPASYQTTAALYPYQQYARIRLAGRGGPQPHLYIPSSSAVYEFLINPSEVQIQRQTVDQQAFSRAGWQIGVWGEDFISINLHGKTPGKYFAYGTTDFYTEYTQSYRNLQALEMVVENNGYWFEGEQVQSNLQQNVRRIKMHEDVELTVGEFVWSGMFEAMDISEDADSPFLATFSLTFIAWKERFRTGTPYPNSIGGEVQRGHVPPVVTVNVSSLAPSEQQDAALVALINNPQSGPWSQS